MPKRSRPDFSKAVERSGNTNAAKDLLQQAVPTGQLINLEQIQDRVTADTRALNEKHVYELMDSIAVIGLITPLTVDRQYRLLAGGHRKAALNILAREQPDKFAELFSDGIPVHIIDIDAEIDTVDALQIEVEENTQRKNYTAAEIREAARKLEAAGYEKLRGRPSKAQKSLNRELMAVFRLSRRRITDILNDPAEKSEHRCALSEEVSKYQTFLKQSKKFHKQISQQIMDAPENSDLQKIERDLKRVINTLQKVIEQIET